MYKTYISIENRKSIFIFYYLFQVLCVHLHCAKIKPKSFLSLRLKEAIYRVVQKLRHVSQRKNQQHKMSS